MKNILYVLLFALAMPLTGCAQRKAPATKTQAPATPGVTVETVASATAPEQILDVIKAKHKGKVVLIDFWATWCGPCRAAMVQIDPIKEQYLKDKRPVDFVYITGETSPMATWRDAIKSIKGYHYRLTDSQFGGLLKSLGIMCIPTYMIIDKNGKQVYDNIETGGYPGDDVIKGEIDKVL